MSLVYCTSLSSLLSGLFINTQTIGNPNWGKSPACQIQLNSPTKLTSLALKKPGGNTLCPHRCGLNQLHVFFERTVCTNRACARVYIMGL